MPVRYSTEAGIMTDFRDDGLVFPEYDLYVNEVRRCLEYAGGESNVVRVTVKVKMMV